MVEAAWDGTTNCCAGLSYVLCGLLLSLSATAISFHPKTLVSPRQEWLLFGIPWPNRVLSGLACVCQVVSEAHTGKGSENTVT